MATDTKRDNSIMQPATLQEALNIIKFLTSTHSEEVTKLKYINKKQADVVRKLKANRKKELDFLSEELRNYETSLAIRKETLSKQLDEKDEIIKKQLEMIEELNSKLKIQEDLNVPEIKIQSPVDSNSDSGVAFENDETAKIVESKTEIKNGRKCSRRFADSISFLRRVDFSPIKYKPCIREGTKKKEDKKMNLEVPVCKRLSTCQLSNDQPMSDDDRSLSAETVFSDGVVEPIVIRPKKLNDSMNNHFSDDGSEDTSEEIFDRVMTRSSVRRSVKVNPKYKKINRTKSKLLEQMKINIID